jgi:hypothetical protein
MWTARRLVGEQRKRGWIAILRLDICRVLADAARGINVSTGTAAITAIAEILISVLLLILPLYTVPPPSDVQPHAAGGVRRLSWAETLLLLACLPWAAPIAFSTTSIIIPERGGEDPA